ncbi:MAG: hypothetical protein IJO40_12130 [Thermoguttaceae bacterium]|nr:hypothetical protein [Thermoguttaceae bacterium]
MRHETKNERREKKALGYKHEWTDTGGHSHRVIFDKKTLERPQTTWKALTFVAALGLLVGGVAILTAPRDKNNGRLPLAPANARPDFALSTTLRNLTTERPVALAAGWGDEFFLADRAGVGLYRVGDGERLQYWESAEGDAPTALTFVADETSEKNGALLIAYPERIDAIYFATDRVETDAEERGADEEAEKENDVAEEIAPNRTAQNAALGEATTILTIPGASIAAVAATPERLFVGDFNAERVWRYSWRTLDALKNAEKKETPPDCEIGAPDGGLSYPGFRPATEPYMSVVYSPTTNEIVVANSGLLRVDAFNVDSGAWKSEHSWTKTPGTERAFAGAANPVALVVSPSGWIATAETGKIDAATGKKSPLQIFDAKSGSWISEILNGTSTENEARAATPIDLALSEDGRQILALKSNGEVEIYANH